MNQPSREAMAGKLLIYADRRGGLERCLASPVAKLPTLPRLRRTSRKTKARQRSTVPTDQAAAPLRRFTFLFWTLS
jgi:hypothetical protein